MIARLKLARQRRHWIQVAWQVKRNKAQFHKFSSFCLVVCDLAYRGLRFSWFAPVKSLAREFLLVLSSTCFAATTISLSARSQTTLPTDQSPHRSADWRAQNTRGSPHSVVGHPGAECSNAVFSCGQRIP